jgi:DNA-binding NarL/FixJ family response regulator
MSSLRILVVDDHAVVRRGVRALLEGHPGWEVCGEAGTGREAVEKAGRLKPDIVVLDLSLPELNGLEATRQILRESPRTEVLVLTMHHSEELAQQVLQAGARGYILKSDAGESLVAAVETLVRREPFLTPRLTELVLERYVRGPGGREGDSDGGIVLTPREREVVLLVAEGSSSKAIASALGISVKTVETHRTNVMRKLRLRSVSELVRYAIRNGLVEA